jgi:hypothetical protein
MEIQPLSSYVLPQFSRGLAHRHIWNTSRNIREKLKCHMFRSCAEHSKKRAECVAEQDCCHRHHKSLLHPVGQAVNSNHFIYTSSGFKGLLNCFAYTVNKLQKDWLCGVAKDYTCRNLSKAELVLCVNQHLSVSSSGPVNVGLKASVKLQLGRKIDSD